MCTILILRGVHRDRPLILGANRDEFYSRVWSGPQVLSSEQGIIGARDDVHGGTWMGFNARAMVAAVTNQRTFRLRDDRLQSRGLIVTDLLTARSVDEARSKVDQLDARNYNSFNVLFGTPSELYVGYARQEERAVEVIPVTEGISVLTNDRLDSPDFPKIERAKSLLLASGVFDERARDGRVAATDHELELVLRSVLSDHATPDIGTIGEPPRGSPFTRELIQQLHAICIHTPVYGTSSSTILTFDQHRVRRYAFAHGAPCTHRYEDYTRELITEQ